MNCQDHNWLSKSTTVAANERRISWVINLLSYPLLHRIIWRHGRVVTHVFARGCQSRINQLICLGADFQTFQQRTLDFASRQLWTLNVACLGKPIYQTSVYTTDYMSEPILFHGVIFIGLFSFKILRLFCLPSWSAFILWIWTNWVW